MADLLRFIGAATALLLFLLGSQAVLAQYGTQSLVLSSSTVTAGGTVTVSGGGFAGASEVKITIQSQPVLLATATTAANGNFSVVVTVPTSFSGQHTIVATGTDPAGSLLVLSAPITVASSLPQTSTDPQLDRRSGASDPIVLAGAGAGIVVMTGLLLLAARRSRRRALDGANEGPKS